MSAYLILLIKAILALVSLAFANFMVGRSLLSFYKSNAAKNYYEYFFKSSLTGTIAIVIVISLIKTQFNSINLLFLLLIIFIFIEKKIKKNNEKLVSTQIKPHLKSRDLITLLVFLSIAFLWNCSVIFIPSEFPIAEIEKDSFYYAEISKCLIQTGNENTFLTANLIGDTYHAATPYHYFDLWINGFMAKVFKINYAVSLHLITYAYFLFLFAIGIISMFGSFQNNKIINSILTLALLFIGGLFISENIFHLFQYQSQMEGMNERFGGKLAMIYGFALASMMSFKDRNYSSGLFYLFLLPILSISLAPAIYGGIILYCSILFFKNSEKRSESIRYLFYAALLLTAIQLFYAFNKNSHLNYRLDKPLLKYTDFTEFSFFRLKFFLVEFFLKSWAQPFLFALNYLPFILLAVYYYFISKSDKTYRHLVHILICIWVCGLTAFSTLYLLDDAHQFFTNTHVLAHVLFAFTFVLLYQRKDAFKFILLIPFLFGLIFRIYLSYHSFKKVDVYGNKVSEEYLIKVNQQFDSITQITHGGVMYDKILYNNTRITYPLEFYLCPTILNPLVYTPFNLTPEIINEKWNLYQYDKAITRSPFVLFCRSESQKNKSVLENQIDFIQKYNIKYLIIPTSDTLKYEKYFQIKQEIKDKLSGQKIIFLN
ncbi:MAG: hypothetical protein IPM51_07460 [Sphingobacteriaceae bacterium]|nr:hypothetical protein [Sphingobacteriaceae bacterium]